MNRKILSVVTLALVTTLSVPLAQADREGYRDGGRDGYREVRVQRVERYYSRDDHEEYHHDRGRHRGWYQRERYERDDYYAPPPRAYRNDYPVRRSPSPVPILAGSVIGGVLGHSVSRGDPGDTAVGAVIGTIIGYEIVRNRDY
ncbi:MAG: glycine zipper 2TM domain-containing protein [Sulfuricaulis sp.]